MKLLISLLSAATAYIICMAPASANESMNLLSLKNLERERAAFIETMLSEHKSAENKFNQSLRIQRQLIDMERMVIRDERLSASDLALAHDAFSDFDLTFLMHASAEKETVALAHWLDSVGLSDENLKNAQAGYRK